MGKQIPGHCLRAEKLWNMKETVVPMVVRALGTVSEKLEKRMEIRRIETKQTKYLDSKKSLSGLGRLAVSQTLVNATI